MGKLIVLTVLLIALAIIGSITTVALKGFPNEKPSYGAQMGPVQTTPLERVSDPLGTTLE